MSAFTGLLFLITTSAGVVMGYWFHSKLRKPCSCKRDKTE